MASEQRFFKMKKRVSRKGQKIIYCKNGCGFVYERGKKKIHQLYNHERISCKMLPRLQCLICSKPGKPKILKGSLKFAQHKDSIRHGKLSQENLKQSEKRKLAAAELEKIMGETYDKLEASGAIVRLQLWEDSSFIDIARCPKLTMFDSKEIALPIGFSESSKSAICDSKGEALSINIAKPAWEKPGVFSSKPPTELMLELEEIPLPSLFFPF